MIIRRQTQPQRAQGTQRFRKAKHCVNFANLAFFAVKNNLTPKTQNLISKQMKNYKILLLLFAIISSQNAYNQSDERVWENKVYKGRIKSVVIHQKGSELLFPAIELGSDNKIVLQFDELGTDIGDYSYSVTLCDADWHESKLMSMEYVSGFNDINIRDYAFSQNTLVNYVNYSIGFPNKDLSFSKSGNYVVKVYERDNPENVVLVRRFYVYSKLTKVEARVDLMNVQVPDDINQRININLDCSNQVENPAATVFIKVQQNRGLTKNFKTIKPTFVNGQHLEFKAISNMTFAGGNEFRHFDIKNFKFISDRILNTEKMPDLHYVYLRQDEDKSRRPYKFQYDLNGQRTIKLENNNLSNIMADYCYVYFSLYAPLPLQDGDFYIYGALTNWEFSDAAKMRYNAEKQLFEGKLFLKQGYYTYSYVFKPRDDKLNAEADRYLVEGNHFQTENEYYIFVYYKSYSADYDQLIAFERINSTRSADY